MSIKIKGTAAAVAAQTKEIAEKFKGYTLYQYMTYIRVKKVLEGQLNEALGCNDEA